MADVGDYLGDTRVVIADGLRKNALDFLHLARDGGIRRQMCAAGFSKSLQLGIHGAPFRRGRFLSRAVFEVSNFCEYLTRRVRSSQSSRRNVPLRPPLFSSNRTRSMVITRSTDLHMS